MKTDRTYKINHVVNMARKYMADPLATEGMKKSPMYIASWVAHDSPLYCHYDNKIWNNARGEKMYREVFFIMVAAGMVKMEFKE